MDTLARRLKTILVDLIENGYLYFGAGGALGFDTLAAQIVLELKTSYPHIKLILVLPCLSQTDSWSSHDQEIYEYIKATADKVVYTSREYTKGCMHKRNHHLVDNSSACICYLTEKQVEQHTPLSMQKERICLCSMLQKNKKSGIFSPLNYHLFRKVYNSTKERPNPL